MARIGPLGSGLFGRSFERACCRSSVVEHSIGNGEVDSSILSGSTIYLSKSKPIPTAIPVRLASARKARSSVQVRAETVQQVLVVFLCLPQRSSAFDSRRLVLTRACIHRRRRWAIKDVIDEHFQRMPGLCARCSMRSKSRDLIDGSQSEVGASQRSIK
jgi:hypothetical protein